MVGAVAQLPELRVAGGPDAAGAQPHGKVHSRGHRSRTRHGRLRRRQHQVCNRVDTESVALTICPGTDIAHVTQGQCTQIEVGQPVEGGMCLRTVGGVRRRMLGTLCSLFTALPWVMMLPDGQALLSPAHHLPLCLCSLCCLSRADPAWQQTHRRSSDVTVQRSCVRALDACVPVHQTFCRSCKGRAARRTELLSPKAHESPALVTTAEWFLPPAPAMLVCPFSAATSVGTFRCRRSPCPS